MSAESFAAYSDAALSAIGLIHNVYGAASHAERKSARSLMDLQLKQNKELFDYQNEYNAPINQIARLKQAGLNPGLMYGSHGSTGNAANAALAAAEVPKQMGAYTNLNQVIEQARKGVLSAVGLYNELEMQKWKRKQAKAEALQAQVDYQLKVNEKTRSDAKVPFIFSDVQREQDLANMAKRILSNKQTMFHLDYEMKKMAAGYQNDTLKERLEYAKVMNRIRSLSASELEFKIEQLLPLEVAMQKANIAYTNANVQKVKQVIAQIAQEMKQSANNFEWSRDNMRPWSEMLAKYNAYMAKDKWKAFSVSPAVMSAYGGFEDPFRFDNDMPDLSDEVLGNIELVGSIISVLSKIK